MELIFIDKNPGKEKQVRTLQLTGGLPVATAGCAYQCGIDLHIHELRIHSYPSLVVSFHHYNKTGDQK